MSNINLLFMYLLQSLNYILHNVNNFDQAQDLEKLQFSLK